MLARESGEIWETLVREIAACITAAVAETLIDICDRWTWHCVPCMIAASLGIVAAQGTYIGVSAYAVCAWIALTAISGTSAAGNDRRENEMDVLSRRSTYSGSPFERSFRTDALVAERASGKSDTSAESERAVRLDSAGY